MFPFRTLGLPIAALGLLLSACSTTPAPSAPVTSGYACGQLDIQVTTDPDRRLVSIDYLDKRMLLKPAESASGALYIAPGDDTTRFWNKGERALLTIRGQQFPECLQPGALEMPFTAQGNEPFWHAVLASGELELTRPYETNTTVRLPVEVTVADRHGREFVATSEDTRATLTVARQLCQDSMSGAQFPSQVRLNLNGEVYQGCGGNRLRLFRGAEWVVDDLGARGIIDRSRMSIQFLENNRVAGRASCNRYTGRYEFNGEGGITISQLATTRMACAPALMEQETRFLDVLGRSTTARIGPYGELLLVTPEAEVIKAFQSDHDTP